MNNKKDNNSFEKVVFEKNDEKALKFFVKYGYVHYKNLYPKELINRSSDYLSSSFQKLKKLSEKGEFPNDFQGWGNAVLEKFVSTFNYESIVENPKTIDVLKKYLGNDIAILNYDNLWINIPENKDPVSIKKAHTDVWTGMSINTLLANIYFTDVDDFNGLTVYPCSHLQGIMPVRNRAPDPLYNVQFDPLNLNNIEKGDFILWHPLLLHSTTGNSNKNIRISMSMHFTSTETEFTTQEKTRGYRTISVSPLKQISRIIGNDYLTPFRTYGGYAGIELRLKKLYNLVEQKSDSSIDYSKYID